LNPEKIDLEASKKEAAYNAVKHVEDGYIVGLGSGSTAAYAIETLGERIRRESLKILAIPSSYQAFLLAAKQRIAITTLTEHPRIDVAIDGADQIDPQLNLIKGMGAALAREKIAACASKQNIIIADESKKVTALGEKDQPVPIEVLPFAISMVMHEIKAIGGEPNLREGKGKVGPIITDNGNMIVDANFGVISHPAKLEKKLKMIAGVVETGLFIKLANIAYIGTHHTVERIERKN
jgi:ribose 5-phosphate isomerase A